MRFTKRIVGVGAFVVAVAGCKNAASGPYKGVWQYDQQSLRELALASAYESITAGGENPLTAEEQTELERWVNEQHDQWDKRLEVFADGRFVAVSRTSESQPETTEGTWTLGNGEIVFAEHSGERMASGYREGANLVLVMTDDEGTSGRMVMLPADETE